MTPRSRSFRPLFLETRRCLHCGHAFLTRCRELVYCSAVCGRLARGLDEHGGPLPKVERAA